MANSVDPDQMLHSVPSDLGLNCLLRLSVPILRVVTVVLQYTLFLFHNAVQNKNKTTS